MCYYCAMMTLADWGLLTVTLPSSCRTPHHCYALPEAHREPRVMESDKAVDQCIHPSLSCWLMQHGRVGQTSQTKADCTLQQMSLVVAYINKRRFLNVTIGQVAHLIGGMNQIKSLNFRSEARAAKVGGKARTSIVRRIKAHKHRDLRPVHEGASVLRDPDVSLYIHRMSDLLVFLHSFCVFRFSDQASAPSPQQTGFFHGPESMVT